VAFGNTVNGILSVIVAATNAVKDARVTSKTKASTLTARTIAL